MDKYEPKYVVSASALITVMGNYMMLSSSELTFYVLGRLLTGFGSAAAIIGWFKIITMSYAKQDFIKVMGITTFICFLIIFGLFYLIDYLKQVVEWRTIILMLSLLGIVISLIFFIFTPVGYSQHIEEEHPKRDFKLIFLNRRILRLVFLGFFCI